MSFRPVLLLLCATLAVAQTPTIAQRLAKWKNVDMPFHTKPFA